MPVNLESGEKKKPFENIPDLNELCVAEEYPAHIIFAFSRK